MVSTRRNKIISKEEINFDKLKALIKCRSKKKKTNTQA